LSHSISPQPTLVKGLGLCSLSLQCH
jgi:hypothetical protein